MKKRDPFPAPVTRRRFVAQLGLASTSAFLSRVQAEEGRSPWFQVSLAEWTLNRELRSGKIDHLDFAKVAHDHGIHAIEYVNQFFMDKAKNQAYLKEMNQRAGDLGVKQLLIMCDREGNIGDPDAGRREKTVDGHRKWLDAAKILGCHSIRVNAGSRGSWAEQVHLAADGLSRLTEFGATMNLNVIVENHGGLSSNADWLSEVIKQVGHPRCGTLPDTGNFRVNAEQTYDSYRGVRKLMKWAKGVSIKDRVWDDQGGSAPMDFEKMLKIVHESGFRGFCGIEYGGYEGLNRAREALEGARDAVAG